MSEVQYITNKSGRKTSVVVPIEDWNRLSSYVKELETLDEIEMSIKQGMKEMRAFEAGATQPQSTKDFLDAL